MMNSDGGKTRKPTAPAGFSFNDTRRESRQSVKEDLKRYM